MPDDVTILIEPDEDDLTLVRVRDQLRRTAAVLRYFPDVDPEELQVDEPVVPVRAKGRALERGVPERAPFTATAFHAATNRAIEIRGTTDRPEDVEVRPSTYRPNPSGDELRAAEAILREGPEFPQREDVIVYQPMPPLADLVTDDGTSRRRISLGVYDPQGERRHRFAAVDLAAREVEWDAPGLEQHPDGDCEAHLPVGVGDLPDAGGPARVRVRVLRDGVELWSFLVVRPRNTSPGARRGAGVELRYVRYRGHLVLWQAHVPILNVLYDDGVTYRDWQNQETRFDAVGADPVGPGWRVCSQPPQTILESASDAGNFQGVAFWYEDGELRIVSEMAAGWYRYVSDWRLRDDGSIGPRFGFAGTRNPRTCMKHHHHAYWRLDFDIDGAGRDVIEGRRLFALPGRPAWTPVQRERSVRRGFLTSWRVRDLDSGRGYRIVPGAVDGTADDYGKADLWFLRYHGNEIDDGVNVTGGSAYDTAARIDQFVNDESLVGTDVVVWYAGHFTHDEHAPEPHQGHIVGPELRPFGW